MKNLLSNLFILLVLAFAFSGCGGGYERTSGDAPPPSNAAPEGEARKRSGEYPPLAAAVAEAEIKNLDGTTFKVADKKGKVLLLNMWATWCGPCRAEMPALVRMQETHGPKGFEVIGLNTDDETVEQINDFAAEMKLNYPLVWADTNLQNSLLKISKFQGIPQSFLVDREGHLRGVFLGGGKREVQKMEEVVAAVMSE